MHMTATEVIPGLYVGDQADSRRFSGHRICVVEGPHEHKYAGEKLIPILRVTSRHGPYEAIPDRLEKVAEEVDRLLNGGRRVLVRCGEGRERSVLAVAYYLATRKGMTWEQAYRLLLEKRPGAFDRRSWLPPGFLPPP